MFVASLDNIHDVGDEYVAEYIDRIGGVVVGTKDWDIGWATHLAVFAVEVGDEFRLIEVEAVANNLVESDPVFYGRAAYDKQCRFQPKDALFLNKKVQFENGYIDIHLNDGQILELNPAQKFFYCVRGNDQVARGGFHAAPTQAEAIRGGVDLYHRVGLGQ